VYGHVFLGTVHPKPGAAVVSRTHPRLPYGGKASSAQQRGLFMFAPLSRGMSLYCMYTTSATGHTIVGPRPSGELSSP